MARSSNKQQPGAARRFCLRPLGIEGGEAATRAVAAGLALPLAGGPLAFTAIEWLERGAGADISRRVLDLGHLRRWSEGSSLRQAVAARLDLLSRRRQPFAGLALDRPLVMGVVNVTPDSFSDGGDFADGAAAIAHGLAMLDAGADILDIGGESTRPGSDPVSPELESARILPVVRALAERGAVVSVDTRRPAVMAAAIGAGARIVNDVTALREPGAIACIARTGACAVLMHMLGEPRTMQADPRYDDAAFDIHDFLQERVAACVTAGISLDRLAVDPGIGFGKTVAHNVELLDQFALFHGLGAAVLLGASRKSFIARLSRDEAPKDRLPGSLAAALRGLAQGAQILRVHDLAETLQALKVWRAGV
jgi:dihydropteroate synthase